MNESNFVVKTIFHARGSSEVLTENYFATRKEAEEFCALTDYAMKLNYGAEQQLVTTDLVRFFEYIREIHHTGITDDPTILDVQ